MFENPSRKAPHPSRTIRNAILGRNAARAYNFDPDHRRYAIHCDDVQKLREDGYIQRPGTLTEAAPLRMNQTPGPRTRREVRFGELERLALAGEGRWRLTATPERGFDLGAGRGRAVTRTVRSGVVGLVIDTRGRRPFALPAEPGERIARLRHWNRALELYPREV